MCASDSELHILVSSQKQIYILFVQVGKGFLLCEIGHGDVIRAIYLFTRVILQQLRYVFGHGNFKPTSTTDTSGAAPSALRSALDSSI